MALRAWIINYALEHANEERGEMIHVIVDRLLKEKREEAKLLRKKQTALSVCIESANALENSYGPEYARLLEEIDHSKKRIDDLLSKVI